MRPDIEFFYAILPRPCAMPIITTLGRGADGTLWVQAAYLGISPEALDEIRQSDEGLLLVAPEDGCIYVEVQALLESCGSLGVEKAVMAAKDELLERLHPSNFRQ